MRKTILTGLLLGLVLSFVSLAWLFRASTQIVFESDSAKTLGLKFESIGQVALRPLTKSEIALRLGMKSEAELAAQIVIFAERVSGGFLTKDWSQKCAQGFHPHLCYALDDYFGKIPTLNSAAAPSPKKETRRIGAKLRFDARGIKDLQREDFNYLVSRIPDWNLKQFVKFADLSLNTNDCPRNFTLAMARKAEVHMPEELAWVYLKRLQTHALPCLTPDHSGAEFNYLRAALISYSLGNFLEASVLLERASKAVDKKEEYRVLYWLAKSYQAIGKSNEASRTASILYSKFPISWHSILLKVENRIDPLEIFLKRPVELDKYSSGEDLHNLRVLWLQALIEYENFSYSSKKYGEFVVRRLNAQVDPGLLQYIARVLDRAGFHRLQIVALNQLLIKHPEHVSSESLRLLFPKPFREELDRSSPHLDTAILLGLARQESGFDPSARSGANAHGLLQLLPSTARSMNKKLKQNELFDYAKNIELGARFLMTMIRYFNGSVEHALAAYNAGQGSVRKWNSRYSFIKDEQLFLDFLPFRETRDYVPSILRNAYWYHRLFPEHTDSLSEVVSTSSMLKSVLFPKNSFVKNVSEALPKVDHTNSKEPLSEADLEENTEN